MSLSDRQHRTKAALFLLIATGVLVGAIVLLGRAHSVFARHATLHTTFDDVGGLINGSAIRLAGLEVGAVTAIHFDRDPKVKRVDVDLSVESRFLPRIRGDSIARVSSKGLLGDMIVDLTVGDEGQPPLKDGDRIPSAEAASLSAVVEQVQHAIAGVDHLATDVDAQLKTLLTPEVTHDFGRMAHSAADVMDQVAHGQGLANALLTKRDLAENVGGAVTDIRGVIGQVRDGPGLAHGLLYDAQGEKLAVDLRDTAQNLASVTHEIKEGDGALHSLVYDQKGGQLVAQLDDTARILHKLAEETDQGKGTVGGLLKDPTAYEDLTELLGNVKRNTVLKALIRYTISKDGLQKPDDGATHGGSLATSEKDR